MQRDLLTADFKAQPQWWDDVPRPQIEPGEPPKEADIVVIGSGYTGLHAALQTARAGRSTVVLDAEALGFGCSTRNGGQISTSVKPGLAVLASRHGPERARAIIREGQNSLRFIGDFIREEGIACDFQVVGRLHAAHAPGQYADIVERVENQPDGLEVACHLVPRERQHEEIGSDLYHGGAVYENHASVHPARYHQGLVELVRRAGATLVAFCPATAIAQSGQHFLVETPRGTIRARDVVVATNGYTGPLTQWLRRRVIPIGSYMIATEPLDPALVKRLIPRNRIVSDTRKVVYYYRASPDGRRILFGGRVSATETDPLRSGPKLHADMAGIFPELAQARISHSWCGFVAYTFDELMHIGRHEGLHYAMGYCGSGVGMGSYLGMRLGQQVLGLSEGRTAFDDLPFQTRPLYTGNPWFLAPSVAYYRLRDRMAR
jgi:glycine/D-amino acid oxidase-like deaminating enzyme